MATRKSSIILSILIVLLASVALVHGQAAGGRLSGVVTDSSGGVVPNAQVTVKNTATQSTRDITANGDGVYNVPNLNPGDYEVRVSATGFSTVVRPDLKVEVGSELVINVELQVGNVNEDVVIKSEAPTVDLGGSALNAVVTGTTVRELPLNGRDWTALATLEPGVATVRTQSSLGISNQRANRGLGAQLTIEGNRPQQNNYRLDGVSINDYSNGAPGSVLGVDLGVDAIQEFSVVTSNATAEYGKSSGGVINAVSRSGSNDFHGSIYEFLRNSALDARNFFDATLKVPPFKRNQFGATAGGPILHDRTFIFGDYEGLRQSLAVNFVSTVPSAAARAGHLVSGDVVVDPRVIPYLALYPLPNAGVTGDAGTYSFAGQQVTHENFFTTRVDHKLTKNDSLFGTFMTDVGQTVGPDTFNNKNTATFSRRKLFTLEDTHIFSSSFVNSARFGFSRVVSLAPVTLDAINPAAGDTTLGFVPGLAVGLINIGGIANFQGGLGAVGEFDFHFNSYQLYDDAFYTRGAHSMKIGASVERIHANQLGTANPNGQFIFGSLANFLTNKPTSFNAPIANSITPRNLRQTVFGVYFQDDWKYKPNLTFNLGLRYETVTVPTEVDNRLSVLANITDAAPKIGAPYFNNPTKRNFSPRVGFAWDPFKDGKTSVRGAFGIYDVLPLTYQFQLLSIFAAPFQQLGNIVNLAPGVFPKAAFPLLTPNRLRYSYIEQNPKRNYVMQWNLNIQREVLPNLTVQLGYVGSHGVHQPFRVDDANTVQPVLTAQGYQFPTPRGSGLRLNPNVGQISALFYEASSSYNAMHLQVKRRLSNGFQIQGSYTWSKSIDTGSSSVAGDTFGNSVSSLPIFDTHLNRGLSDFDIRHNLVISSLWQIPAPQSWTGFQGFITKGWQLGGIFQASSGLPFTATIGGDPLGLNSADTYDFPNRLNTPECRNPVNPGNAQHYIKTECFTLPANGTLLGNAGRNTLIGPGLTNVDLSVYKTTPVKWVSENFKIQFRAEVFNALNHPNFSPPSNPNRQIFNSSLAPIATAGRLTATATTARQIQFALKMTW
jgi:hypothetical protein